MRWTLHLVSLALFIFIPGLLLARSSLVEIFPAGVLAGAPRRLRVVPVPVVSLNDASSAPLETTPFGVLPRPRQGQSTRAYDDSAHLADDPASADPWDDLWDAQKVSLNPEIRSIVGGVRKSVEVSASRNSLQPPLPRRSLLTPPAFIHRYIAGHP